MAAKTKPKSEVQELFEYARKLQTPNLWELKEVYRYTEPSREWEKGYDTNVQADRQWQYDVTAITCVNDLQTNVMSLLVPSSERWAEIGFAKDVYDTKWGAQYARNLQAANEALFEHFAYSNFYQAYGEATRDSIIAGTACLFIVNRPGRPICYMPIPLNQLYFIEDYDGRVQHVFREHEKTTEQLIGQFGKLPDVIAKEDARDTQLHKIIEVALTDPITGKTSYTVYLHKNWEPLVPTVVSKYKPFHVWRWSKSLNNPWGESPVRHALPAIRSVNVMMECTIASGEFASQGLWQATGESTNADNLRSQLEPGTIVFTEEEIKPLQFPGEFNIGQQLISDTRQQIRDLLLSKPQRDVNKTPITAEQVVNDRDEFFKRIGEPARRMQDESLQPIAKDVFGMLCERGDIMLATPQQVKGIDPKAKSVTDIFHVEVSAAITKVLKIQEAQQTLQAMNVMAQTFGEQMLMKQYDLDLLARDLGTGLGISQRYQRSEKAAAQIAQQQSQQAAMDQSSGQLTEFAKTAAKTPVGQNFMNSMLNNMAQMHDTRPVVNAAQSTLTS